LIRPPVPSATLLPTSGLAPRRAVDQPGWLTSSRTPNLRNRMVDVETNIVDFWPRELHFPSRSLVEFISSFESTLNELSAAMCVNRKMRRERSDFQ